MSEAIGLRTVSAPEVTSVPRVMLLTPDFPPARGGIQLLLRRLVENWHGPRPSVVTIQTPGAREFDRAQPYRIVRVAARFPRRHRAAVALLNARSVSLARRWSPNVVISGHIVASPAAAMISRLHGAPYIQYLYADEVPGRPRLARFAIRRAAAVIAISSHTEALARAYGADPGRLHRVLPGVDRPAIGPGPKAPRPTIVTVSRLSDPYKGHDVMIEALPRIRARVPEVRWLVIGDGPLRAGYERMVRARGLMESVEFTGELSDMQRDCCLSQAHVLSMPSRVPPAGGGEGFGIVYLEAGMHHLPVVAGNAGGALDAVVHDDNGLLVDATDPVAVADAIVRLLLDPAYAASLGRNGARRAAALTWSQAAMSLRRLSDELLATRP